MRKLAIFIVFCLLMTIPVMAIDMSNNIEIVNQQTKMIRESEYIEKAIYPNKEEAKEICLEC